MRPYCWAITGDAFGLSERLGYVFVRMYSPCLSTLRSGLGLCCSGGGSLGFDLGRRICAVGGRLSRARVEHDAVSLERLANANHKATSLRSESSALVVH